MRVRGVFRGVGGETEVQVVTSVPGINPFRAAHDDLRVRLESAVRHDPFIGSLVHRRGGVRGGELRSS